MDFVKVAESDEHESWEAQTSRTATPKTFEEVHKLFRGLRIVNVAFGDGFIRVQTERKEGE